jgi:hypothetical protein
MVLRINDYFPKHCQLYDIYDGDGLFLLEIGNKLMNIIQTNFVLESGRQIKLTYFRSTSINTAILLKSINLGF